MTPAELKTELETLQFYSNCDITLIFTELSQPVLSVCFKNAMFAITNLEKQQTDFCKNLPDAMAFIENEFRIQC